MMLIERKKGKLNPTEILKYKKYLKQYDRESFVSVDGMLIEPLNPSISVTKKKFYLTKKLRDKLLGKLQNFDYLNKV